MAKKSKDEIEKRKQCFLRYILLGNDEGKTSENLAWKAWSAMSVVQTVRFYSPEADRCELRRFGWKKAEAIANTFVKNAAGARAEVPDGKFTKRIQKFQEAVESTHGDKLEDGMTFGRAQKFVNLYLKFMWCAGEIFVPPHCPFDDIIISRLISDGAFNGGIAHLQEQEEHANIRRWSKSNNPGDYCKWVAAAKKASGDDYHSLSEWELVMFSEAMCKRERVSCLCQIHGLCKKPCYHDN